MWMIYARFEMNLYENRIESVEGTIERNIETRSNYFNKLVSKYFGLKTLPGTEGGDPWRIPQLSSNPMQYASYTMDIGNSDLAITPIIEALNSGDDDALKRAGDILKGLLSLAAEMSNTKNVRKEVEKAVTTP